MKTFWGDIPVNDSHIHFFSHDFFSALAGQKYDPALGKQPEAVEAVIRTLGWAAPPMDPKELAAEWAHELDRHGVSRAALIASVPGDEPSVAAAAARFPERFYGYFMVNPADSEAIARVDGALAAGLQGICLFPAMHRFSMDDPRLEPILMEASTRSGVVIFVHCGA